MNARMNQIVAFRGFVITRSLERHGIDPDAPSTDIATPEARSAAQRFPLSPPTGLLQWSIDALHDIQRRDPGRAYVTDESYSFTERIDSTVLFYDCPSLWFEAGDRIVASYGTAAVVARLELLGRFRTELWVGSTGAGVVEWVCTWQGSAAYPTLSRLEPRYESVAYHARPPSDGPTEPELQRMIRRWQRDDRDLPRHRR